MPQSDTFTEGQARSQDGTLVGWRQTGTGPGLVVLHGALRSNHHYSRLAESLASEFTVIIPDRRGRGLTPGNPGSCPMATALADLRAVAEATGARFAFGHSAGGTILLEAATCLPLERLVFYEPPIPGEGAPPLGWKPVFERALKENRMAQAFAILARGLELAPRRVPTGVLQAGMSILFLTTPGRELRALLPTVPADLALLDSMDPTLERYRATKVPVLLLGGTKSPAFRHLVAGALPHPPGRSAGMAGWPKPQRTGPGCAGRCGPAHLSVPVFASRLTQAWAFTMRRLIPPTWS